MSDEEDPAQIYARIVEASNEFCEQTGQAWSEYDLAVKGKESKTGDLLGALKKLTTEINLGASKIRRIVLLDPNNEIAQELCAKAFKRAKISSDTLFTYYTLIEELSIPLDSRIHSGLLSNTFKLTPGWNRDIPYDEILLFRNPSSNGR